MNELNLNSKRLIKQTANGIDAKLHILFFKYYAEDERGTLYWHMQNYARRILLEIDFDSYKKTLITDLEYIEWFYNSILYCSKTLYELSEEDFFNLLNKIDEHDGLPFLNIDIWKNLIDLIKKICDLNNWEFNIDENENIYKLVPKKEIN